ncbi:hypothetical protein GOODEAATRI_034401 [Goodea atripinnis]|uniref:Uncharacterized protein n=1 Tax=Goodea atripinnis TaxID=208336 RepID=A0ABV0MN24_9TELE
MKDFNNLSLPWAANWQKRVKLLRMSENVSFTMATEDAPSPLIGKDFVSIKSNMKFPYMFLQRNNAWCSCPLSGSEMSCCQYKWVNLFCTICFEIRNKRK